MLDNSFKSNYNNVYTKVKFLHYTGGISKLYRILYLNLCYIFFYPDQVKIKIGPAPQHWTLGTRAKLWVLITKLYRYLLYNNNYRYQYYPVQFGAHTSSPPLPPSPLVLQVTVPRPDYRAPRSSSRGGSSHGSPPHPR